VTPERLAEIEDAYGYCVERDKWPDGFNPFATIHDLLAATRAFNRSIVAHHNIAHLSDDAIKESIGGACQICARAQVRDVALDFSLVANKGVSE
jgi:hypothetical protein